MRNKSFFLNACACAMLLLAICVLTSVLYGQWLPPCNGTIPSTATWCADGTVCPSTTDTNTCISSQCVAIAGFYPPSCTTGGNPDTQLCGIEESLCSYTYWCWINPSFGTCDCSSTQVINPATGNPIYSTAPQGVAQSCSKPRS